MRQKAHAAGVHGGELAGADVGEVANSRTDAETVDDLLAWLEEHNHPALLMEPMF